MPCVRDIHPDLPVHTGRRNERQHVGSPQSGNAVIQLTSIESAPNQTSLTSGQQTLLCFTGRVSDR